MKPSPLSDLIAQNLRQIRQRIRDAAHGAGRNTTEIGLLAVSKTKPMEAIEAAYASGQRAFGENYLQDAMEKITQLTNLDIDWHFIGKVQSNKTKAIAENFHWVHGLASLKHARRLDAQRPTALAPLNACIQVNLSQQDSKGGVSEETLLPLAQSMSTLKNIRLRGLMTMPDPESSASEQQAVFRKCRQLQEQLIDKGIFLDTLSMGMSKDLEAAIAEGATWVRIGTAIFGQRS